MTDTAIATRPVSTMARRDELSIDDMIAQIDKIHQVMKRVMKEGEHYGVIPGTSSKPSLFKPGAEKLCTMFRLAPDPHSVETYDGWHLTVKTKMTLTHIPTGEVWGSGEGSCSTKESKYAYRKGQRLCPDCGKDTIIKSKDEYGGGWLCFKKKGGCGAKWPDGAAEIEGQSVDRVDNEDVADQYNTVLKMANKRALVAAVLNVTAASDIFTQDLEDLPPAPPPKTKAEPPPKAVIDAEDPAVLFPNTSPDDELTRLSVDAQRLCGKLKLREEAKATYRKTYLDGADLLDPNLDKVKVRELVNALRARAGEPKFP